MVKKNKNDLIEKKDNSLDINNRTTYKEKQNQKTSLFNYIKNGLRTIYERRQYDNPARSLLWILIGSIIFYSSIYGMMSMVSNQFNAGFLLLINIVGYPISIMFLYTRTIFYKMYLSQSNDNVKTKHIYSLISFNNFIKLILFPTIVLNIWFNSHMTYYWFGFTLFLYEILNIFALRTITKRKYLNIIMVEIFPCMFYGIVLVFIIF